MSTPTLPARARVVVIGGGVIGSSVAYHLAHAGWSDVLLLERDRLTSGTTWHAAGLMVTFGSLSETSTRMRQYTRDLYSRLEAETGQATGFKPVGFIEVATEPGRLEEYRRVSAFNRYLGVDVHEITPAEVADMFPIARTDDVLAGFYVAEDGRANPVDVTMALAKGARLQGATLVEGCPVTQVLTKDGAVTGVRTPYGDVECEVVVNCAGMWARQLGAQNGVSVPLQAAEHYYLITDDMPGLSPDAPVLEDPGAYGYFREETGGLMVGLFEGVAAPWKVEGIPADASFTTIPPDWDRMGPFLEKAMARVPASFDVGVRTFFCGPESFTPDLSPVVGEAPEMRGYFVAAGLNSIGILTGGGIGRVVAHWVMNGRPDVDVTAMGVDRLHAYQTNPEYRRARTAESLGLVYACHYPDRSPTTARGAKRSPWHDRLAAAGAYFRDVSGWESPGWYAPEGNAHGVEPVAHELTWGRSPWWACWEAEHRAVREGVGLMDMSFMAKFRVQGRDAGRFLDHVSANAVDGAPGVITYTQWLDEGGTLEADLTVTKLADDDFLVVASDTAHRHVETHLRRRLEAGPLAGAHAFVTDVTSGLAQLNVQGPRSRDLLQTLTSADLSNEAFGFRSARWVDLGLARVLLVRITYLGELGYELYVPAEQAVHVYDRVVEAGAAFGLVHVGLKALSSLRLEKAYRDYGHDIDNTDDVWEAGLGFAVALDKPGGFVGRDAALAQKQARDGVPPRRRLAQVLLRDPEALLVHAEVVRRDGVPVGYVRAGSYGWTLGGAVGLAMLEPTSDLLPDGEGLTQAWVDAGTWEVEVAERRVPATVSLRPLYDPANARIKA
ncbi:FAD-dependent oxidoreductase [Kineosporia sp. A_224]|uniref:GcvT family protein n=1 Tax=Kineosporia sp. A_224 TaxID=1962180 RepID=UPI000B4AC129|nr:FAD-dependent oxidoreductase [Kineosporia sp. A_224]